MAFYAPPSVGTHFPYVTAEQTARAATKSAALDEDVPGNVQIPHKTFDPAVAARVQAKLDALALDDQPITHNTDDPSSRPSTTLVPLYGTDERMSKPVYYGNVTQNLAAVLDNIDVNACEVDGENAFFVVDLAAVRRQHVQWLSELPRVTPFYAVKCNPDPYLMRVLAGLGTGFDCASNGEIQAVLNLGVSPDRIVYANPCKAASFVRQAKRQKVELATFDNADELDKMARFHPQCKLVVRVLADDSHSVCQLGLKFGAPVAAVPGLLAKAKSLNLDVVGVSFHVGSGCYDPLAFRDAVARARSAFDMGDRAGYTFNLLDLGGGFEAESFGTSAAILRQAIDDYFPVSVYAPEDAVDSNKRTLKIIAEPGRFYAAPAFTLAANIIARRDGASDAPACGVTEEEESLEGNTSSAATVAADAEPSPRVMLYQNDGVYGAFNCIVFDHQEVFAKVLTLQRKFVYDAALPTPGLSHAQTTDTSLVPCSIWGPTCDSIDCVARVAMLPAAGAHGLQVGDWLVYEKMGAYTLCAASAFNGIPTPSVRYCLGEGQDAQVVQDLLDLKAL